MPGAAIVRTRMYGYARPVIFRVYAVRRGSWAAAHRPPITTYA